MQWVAVLGEREVVQLADLWYRANGLVCSSAASLSGLVGLLGGVVVGRLDLVVGA